MRQILRMARVALVVLPAIALALPTGASAQGSALGFGLVKPLTDLPADAELLNTAWQISYTRPVGSNGLEIRLPLAMGRYDGLDGEFAIGNAYLGLNMPRGSMTYFGGVNLPLAPDDKPLAVITGAVSDVTDMGAFAVDYLTISGGISSMSANATGVSPFWGAAPQIGIYIGDNDAVDGAEITIRGWGGVNYPMDAFNLTGGVKASFLLTQDDGDDSDTLDFALFGGGSTAAGPGTLGASLTLPLSEDWSDIMSAAIGVNYSLPLD
jgi:hypothetical protein